MQLCDVCGDLVSVEGMLQVGNADGEMAFCAHCSAIAFPGLRDRMRHACPICSDVNQN